MYRTLLPASALAATLGACAAPHEELNSDRIEQRFGSYGVEILSQDVAVRRTSLYSMSDGARICRTYAIVLRETTFSDDIAPVHEEIVAGASIGTAFRASGWTVNKETTQVGSIDLQEASHPLGRLMDLDGRTSLATHVYRLVVTRGETAHAYATIVETHHPDYLDVGELEAMYGRTEAMSREDAFDLYKLVLIDHWD